MLQRFYQRAGRKTSLGTQQTCHHSRNLKNISGLHVGKWLKAHFANKEAVSPKTAAICS